MNKKYVLSLLAALVLTLNACGKKEDPRPASIPAPTAVPAPAGVTVAAISLGKAVGNDKKVVQSADSFSSKDTIHMSVDTTGAGTAALKAKWTYRKNDKEAIVKDETQTIVATGPATHEFHISKPDGWPVGDYQVTVFVDEKSAGTKSFTVK